MSIDQTALRDRIRREAGNPAADVVSNEDIDNFITEALEEFDRYILNWRVAYITTVKDQQAYAVHEDAIEVTFCDWRGGAETLGDLFGDDFDVQFPGQTYDPMLDQVDSLVAALKEQQIDDQSDWEWNEGEQKLWLIPPPSTADKKVYYIYLVSWTLSTCADKFKKYLVWYGVFNALKERSRRQRRASAVAHTGGTFPWTQADPELADARKLETKFNNAMIAESKRNPLLM